MMKSILEILSWLCDVDGVKWVETFSLWGKQPLRKPDVEWSETQPRWGEQNWKEKDTSEEEWIGFGEWVCVEF